MKILCIIISMFLCSSAFAGSWTKYDYGTGTYTTGRETTIGGRTRGTAYDWSKGTYSTYTIRQKPYGGSRMTTYDWGTGTYSTTDYRN